MVFLVAVHHSCVWLPRITFTLCITGVWYCLIIAPPYQDDCGDSSDEPDSCPAFRCELGQLQCSNDTCLHPAQICDGQKQCPEGEDEQNCDAVGGW